MALNLPHPGLIVTLVGYFGLLFLTTKFRDRAAGIGFVFALTGFMGYTLGPILNTYLALPNGPQIVMSAFAATGAMFAGSPATHSSLARDLSFMGCFLTVGILVGIRRGPGCDVFRVPGLSLAVSAMFVLLMSGLILYETSNIIHGGETNYVMATVTLYRIHLQPVHQPAASAGIHEQRRVARCGLGDNAGDGRESRRADSSHPLHLAVPNMSACVLS